MKNQRKLELLAYVDRYEPVTASELAGALDLEVHNARMLLKNYWRQGRRLRRRIDERGTRAYWITEKGQERIACLS